MTGERNQLFVAVRRMCAPFLCREESGRRLRSPAIGDGFSWLLGWHHHLDPHDWGREGECALQLSTPSRPSGRPYDTLIRR